VRGRGRTVEEVRSDAGAGARDRHEAPPAGDRPAAAGGDEHAARLGLLVMESVRRLMTEIERLEERRLRDRARLLDELMRTRQELNTIRHEIEALRPRRRRARASGRRASTRRG